MKALASILIMLGLTSLPVCAQQVDFVKTGYYKLFYVIPAGGKQFITDTPDPLPPGPPTTTRFGHWDLPTDFPRKVLICRTIVIWESAGYNTLQSYLTPPAPSGAYLDPAASILYDLRQYLWQFMTALKWLLGRTNMEGMVWVDPGGLHFSTATPPGAENSDYSKLNVVMHEFNPNPMLNYDTKDCRYPIPFNRDAGDKLAIQVNNADALNWLGVSIQYLSPAPFQP